MSERLRNNQPSVLILADFLDGSWHATSFAMQFLYKEKAPISILQTYQTPSYGHFMMRKLSHHLKEITKNELKALKNKVIRHYKINKQEISILSMEGELNSILNYKPIIKEPHNLVLCTNNSFIDSCYRQNGFLEKIINTATNPLFILPKTFEGKTAKKLLLVGNPNKNTSEQLSKQIKDICEKTQSSLEILFVTLEKNQKTNPIMQSYYKEHFNGHEVIINTIQNKTKCKGLIKYLGDSNRDLIIIEND